MPDRQTRYYIHARTGERIAWDAPKMPPIDPPISRAHGWTEVDEDAFRVLSGVRILPVERVP
ncbi:MAG: hypothetical protein EA351_00345 [Gemmatimonadales bacterium]|nr:MAG: hypothetical protein EA351_00345 [Gemmatimonadales bacterium]